VDLGDDYDDYDEYERDGLHADQRDTPGRRKNPGKYTDKSMRQAHSKRSKRRERTAAQGAVMGEDDYAVRGLCVNTYGAIKPCRKLVTRVNFRPTFVNNHRLPLHMMYAMLLDEQPEVVRTYDPDKVRDYLAGVVCRALGGEYQIEPAYWYLLSKFTTHTINMLSQLGDMKGREDPITVLAERYLAPAMTIEEGKHTIRMSINDEAAGTPPAAILRELKKLVQVTTPQVKLWSYNTESQNKYDTVYLRRGQIKAHQWGQLVDSLHRSIEEFSRGRAGVIRGESDDEGEDEEEFHDDDDDDGDGDGNGGRRRRRGGRRPGVRGRPPGRNRGGIRSRREMRRSSVAGGHGRRGAQDGLLWSPPSSPRLRSRSRSPSGRGNSSSGVSSDMPLL